MQKKFEVNQTNIKGGCQSYIKAAPQQSWSDLTLITGDHQFWHPILNEVDYQFNEIDYPNYEAQKSLVPYQPSRIDSISQKRFQGTFAVDVSIYNVGMYSSLSNEYNQQISIALRFFAQKLINANPVSTPLVLMNFHWSTNSPD